MMTDLASTTPQSLGRDPMVGLRLARVDGFEPAIALGQDELPAYLRRFTMLFADDATMRRGGIGRVTRAVNAQGEAVALKQLILPARDEFDDDAAHEALVAKFKAAFREEYECHRALSGLKGFPSYDPIRCQEPQWPRRPLAIGRRGLPLNPSRSAPGMSSTPSAQSHIRGYRSVGPHSIPSAGFPKSVEAHAEGSARTAK